MHVIWGAICDSKYLSERRDIENRMQETTMKNNEGQVEAEKEGSKKNIACW